MSKEKWQRQNSPRPPEKPNHTPCIPQPKPPRSQPPRFSVQAPSGSCPCRARAGSAGTLKQVRVNRGAQGEGGRPARCHSPSPAPGRPPRVRGPGMGAPTLHTGLSSPCTHPLAPSRAEPPKQRESWRNRAWGFGAPRSRRGDRGRGRWDAAAAGPASSSVTVVEAQSRPLLPLLPLPLLPWGDSCCCCCCIAAPLRPAAPGFLLSESGNCEKEKKKKSPPCPVQGSRLRASSPLLLAAARLRSSARWRGAAARRGRGRGAGPGQRLA